MSTPKQLDVPTAGDRAVLLCLSLRGAPIDASLAEFADLARSAGATEVGRISGSREQPDPATFAGRGKVAEIGALVEAVQADVLLVNHLLSPRQERNLEREVNCRVVDRTGVILDIFAQRARTFEGKLQVELAQLRHLATRLVRGWTHLERQKGGIGLRGPGETQLETDRRLIGKRIAQLTERLERVRCQRRERRRARMRAERGTVALVGYTNAGKSTLFNQLTGAQAYAADQLFATLDPTLRRLEIAGAGPLVLSDTVGFIRDLPHELVAAFRATLEEAREANLLLFVVDAADEQRDERAIQVRAVLDEIGAGGVPCLEVYNQIDRLDGVAPHVEFDSDGRPRRVWISARSGSGLDLLTAAVAARMGGSRTVWTLLLPPSAARLRARLYAAGAVVAEAAGEDGGWALQIHADEGHLRQWCQQVGCDPARVLGGAVAGGRIIVGCSAAG